MMRRWRRRLIIGALIAGMWFAIGCVGRANADPPPMCGDPGGPACHLNLTPGCALTLWRMHYPLYPWCTFTVDDPPRPQTVT